MCSLFLLANVNFVEPASARCKSSSKLDFYLLTRSIIEPSAFSLLLLIRWFLVLLKIVVP
jgi:hypothetical protein